jgi:hypothetical protein
VNFALLWVKGFQLALRKEFDIKSSAHSVPPWESRFLHSWLRLRCAGCSAVVLFGVRLVIAVVNHPTRFSTRHPISLIDPRSKIDELATFGTERTMRVVFPGDLGAADGAFYSRRHFHPLSIGFLCSEQAFQPQPTGLLTPRPPFTNFKSALPTVPGRAALQPPGLLLRSELA